MLKMVKVEYNDIMAELVETIAIDYCNEGCSEKDGDVNVWTVELEKSVIEELKKNGIKVSE